MDTNKEMSEQISPENILGKDLPSMKYPGEPKHTHSYIITEHVEYALRGSMDAALPMKRIKATQFRCSVCLELWEGDKQ